MAQNVLSITIVNIFFFFFWVIWKTYILYGTIAERLLLHVAYLVREHVLLEVALQERDGKKGREKQKMRS